MSAFRFLKDKWFYISLIIMVLLLVGTFLFVFNRLDRFTRHGKEFMVPNMVGLNYDDAVQRFNKEFTFILLDSIYVKDFPEGAIYQQNPAPGAMVKQGRNVYIIRTSIAPEIVKMPNLRNLSLRQALVTLNAVGLKVDKLMYIDYFARNAVVEQKIKESVIEPKEDVVKGTAITLVMGLGNGVKTTNVPDVVGVNIEDAKNKINSASLNLGVEIFVDSDEPENLFVSRMEPEYATDAMVPLGSLVNVWYRSNKNFDFEWYKYEKFRRDSIVERMRIKKMSADTIKYVIDSFNFILQHRSFSFDSLQRLKDKRMKYDKRLIVVDDLDFDDFDYDIDTNFFYYE